MKAVAPPSTAPVVARWSSPITADDLGYPERAIDDDRFAGAKARQHLDFPAEIAAAADASNLEVMRILGEEHAPFVAHAFNGRDRDG